MYNHLPIPKIWTRNFWCNHWKVTHTGNFFPVIKFQSKLQSRGHCLSGDWRGHSRIVSGIREYKHKRQFGNCLENGVTNYIYLICTSENYYFVHLINLYILFWEHIITGDFCSYLWNQSWFWVRNWSWIFTINKQCPLIKRKLSLVGF